MDRFLEISICKEGKDLIVIGNIANIDIKGEYIFIPSGLVESEVDKYRIFMEDRKFSYLR